MIYISNYMKDLYSIKFFVPKNDYNQFSTEKSIFTHLDWTQPWVIGMINEITNNI